SLEHELQAKVDALGPEGRFLEQDRWPGRTAWHPIVDVDRYQVAIEDRIDLGAWANHAAGIQERVANPRPQPAGQIDTQVAIDLGNYGERAPGKAADVGLLGVDSAQGDLRR